MNVALVILGGMLALPLLLLIAFFAGPMILVPVLVGLCALPFLLVEALVARRAHRR